MNDKNNEIIEPNITQKLNINNYDNNHNIETGVEEVLEESIDGKRRKSSIFADSSDELSETNSFECEERTEDKPKNVNKIRSFATLVELYDRKEGINELTDREVMCLVDRHIISGHKLESVLGDPERAVEIRRQLIEKKSRKPRVLDGIPHSLYDYSLVLGACCESVIGYIPVPLGIAGPLLLNNKQYCVPMATTEKCLVASTSRGCRAIAMSGGVEGWVYKNGMTRELIVVFRSAVKATEAMKWLEIETNFLQMKTAFESNSNFAQLLQIKSRIAANNLCLRFFATTGDAMGMNVMSKGTESALKYLNTVVADIDPNCLSGNFCIDKKSSAVNWIDGRGKSVICEAIIPAIVVKEVLKTSVESLINLNISKNLIGSALAGAIGSNNAQSANIVTAIYIACGQDPAQAVDSSQCITFMESQGSDLYVSTTMPAIDVGTIGGGTILPAQAACLDLLGVKGNSGAIAGSNASELATIVCGTVLAAELSLMSTLTAGHLVESNMKYNLAKINMNTNSIKHNLTVKSSPCLTLP